MNAADHRGGVGELERVHLERVVVGGPGAVQNQHRRRQAELTIPLDVLVHGRHVGMPVAAFPRSKRPIGRNPGPADHSGKPLENDRELGAFDEHDA